MVKRTLQIIHHTVSRALCCAAYLLFLTACHSSTSLPDGALNPGVEKSLADWRKANLSGLHYRLSFHIPESQHEVVTGSVTIEVTEKERQPIVVDFKGERNQLFSLCVNGVSVKEGEIDFKDEHLFIPESYAREGVNEVTIGFIAGDQSLNRNSDYLYTLLVPDRARTLFPCFDQPNLKAEYTLRLEVPEEWVAVSNTTVHSQTSTKEGRKEIVFMPTEPLSTYLFSFVVGKFQQETRTLDGRTISAYYRETDPVKLKQMDTIFNQVFASLSWLEEYTDIPYPFAKYDFIILPGFQYGGMEHTGATLYNDRRMFLNEHATPDEELNRASLIAHETAHMWFGDLVTMDWFDDVWTKEVFANYFAALITEPMFPDVNHRLNTLRTFYKTALSEDRTQGSTAIQQPLDNLKDAGLIYGQIIYNKAPVVMLKMADILGPEAFRTGIRLYLQKFAYGNATWDDLVDILDSQTLFDLKTFSQVWVKEKGMPTIHFTPTDNGFKVRQDDPFGRGLVWPQEFSVIAMHGQQTDTVKVNLLEKEQSYTLLYIPDVIIPNTDGRGYGYFVPDEASLNYLLGHWHQLGDDLTRQSVLMTLYENYLHHRFSDAKPLADSFLQGIAEERNQLIVASLISYLSGICADAQAPYRETLERQLYQLSQTMPDPSARLQVQRRLRSIMTTPAIIDTYYGTWQRADNAYWGENDYTNTAYELALRLPDKEKEILATQRSRIENPDRLQQFDFISRACTDDTLRLDSLFESLKQVENRRIEPYAESLLYYLNHPLRDRYATKYIRAGLELMPEVQRTGDIFFPSNWAYALLGGHACEEAYTEVETFISEHPEFPGLLKNKVLQEVFPLQWAHEERK